MKIRIYFLDLKLETEIFETVALISHKRPRIQSTKKFTHDVKNMFYV